MVAGWVANRNALLCLLFGVGMLHVHVIWSRTRAPRYLIFALVLFALGLGCGEAMLGAAAYVVAWQLLREEGSWLNRLLPLAPYTLIIVCWRLVYDLLGYGVRGSSLYRILFSSLCASAPLPSACLCSSPPSGCKLPWTCGSPFRAIHRSRRRSSLHFWLPRSAGCYEPASARCNGPLLGTRDGFLPGSPLCGVSDGSAASIRGSGRFWLDRGALRVLRRLAVGKGSTLMETPRGAVAAHPSCSPGRLFTDHPYRGIAYIRNFLLSGRAPGAPRP